MAIDSRPMESVHTPSFGPWDINDIVDSMRLWRPSLSRTAALPIVAHLLEARRLGWQEEDLRAALHLAPSVSLASAPMLAETDGRWSLRWPPVTARWAPLANGVRLLVDCEADLALQVVVVSHLPTGGRSPSLLPKEGLSAGEPWLRDFRWSGESSFEQVIIAVMSPEDELSLRPVEVDHQQRVWPDRATRELIRRRLMADHPHLSRSWMFEVLLERLEPTHPRPSNGKGDHEELRRVS